MPKEVEFRPLYKALLYLNGAYPSTLQLLYVGNILLNT